MCIHTRMCMYICMRWTGTGSRTICCSWFRTLKRSSRCGALWENKRVSTTLWWRRCHLFHCAFLMSWSEDLVMVSSPCLRSRTHACVDAWLRHRRAIGLITPLGREWWCGGWRSWRLILMTSASSRLSCLRACEKTTALCLIGLLVRGGGKTSPSWLDSLAATTLYAVVSQESDKIFETIWERWIV